MSSCRRSVGVRFSTSCLEKTFGGGGVCNQPSVLNAFHDSFIVISRWMAMPFSISANHSFVDKDGIDSRTTARFKDSSGYQQRKAGVLTFRPDRMNRQNELENEFPSPKAVSHSIFKTAPTISFVSCANRSSAMETRFVFGPSHHMFVMVEYKSCPKASAWRSIERAAHAMTVLVVMVHSSEGSRGP